MIAYADASFLVSLYVRDSHSPHAHSVLRRGQPPLFVTQLGELEFTNALSLWLFRKDLSPTDANESLYLFRRDIEAGILKKHGVGAAVYDQAFKMSAKHTQHLGTRTLDVLHVASALVLRATAFYTFDRNQSRLAAAEGLIVP